LKNLAKKTRISGIIVYGETIEEAKEMAREALTGFLRSVDARKLKIPNPSKLIDLS
jgi:predicted RNase H-like HicB family nuclease